MKKKNIIIAFAMLLLTGVALSTASYAWFTANTQIQLGDIDVHVSATNGIQVSTDAVNWKDSLTTDELRNAYYDGTTVDSVTQFPDYVTGNQDYLKPVSTNGATTTGKFNMFYGELGNGTITLSQATETNGKCMTSAGEDATEVTTAHTPLQCTAPNVWVDSPDGHFVAFDIFIQSSNPDPVEVGLMSTSRVATSSFPATGNDTLLGSAVRVGFINEGTQVAVADALNLAGATEYTIWEPNANTHTDIAVGRGAVAGNIEANLGAIATGTDVVLDNATNFAALPGGTNGKLLYTNTAGSHYVAGTTPVDAAFAETNQWIPGDDNTPTIFTVNQGISKIRIYVWIEGQDVDCENTVTLGESVKVAIRMNAKATE